jgi:hypothetical protein
MCYIVFTYTFHLWGEKEKDSALKEVDGKAAIPGLAK